LGDFKFWPVALAGVDLIRRRPLVAFGLMSVGMIVSVGFRLCVVISLNLQVYGDLYRLSFNAAWIMMLVGGLLVLVTAAILQAAVMRAFAADEARFRLGLAGDEARLLVLSLLLAPAALIVLLMMAVGSIFAYAAHAGSAVENGLIIAGAILGILLILGLASRLSLAGPIAIREGRLRLEESWRLTRSRRWKVLGVFLVAMALSVAVAWLGTFGVDMAWRALHLPDSHTLHRVLLTAILNAFRPDSLPPLVLSGGLIGLALILQSAPAAALHRVLIGDRGRSQAAVFD
jgi:hypothetical protein